jgi:hypothetical protein
MGRRILLDAQLRNNKPSPALMLQQPFLVLLTILFRPVMKMSLDIGFYFHRGL